MKLRALSLILTVFCSGCFEVTEFNGVPIRQYADHVISFSSQYSATTWSANRALGKENVFPNYGDNSNAWSPSTADNNREHLVIGFDTAQTITKIQIYETWFPGSIDTVYIRNSDTGKWKLIYSLPAETSLPDQARIKTILLVETTFTVDAIRIAMNSPAVSDDPDIHGWNEIDAIAITGQRKKD